MHNDGSPTYISLQDGAAAFAEGCYRAIRNPSGHVVRHHWRGRHPEVPDVVFLYETVIDTGEH